MTIPRTNKNRKALKTKEEKIQFDKEIAEEQISPIYYISYEGTNIEHLEEMKKIIQEQLIHIPSEMPVWYAHFLLRIQLDSSIVKQTTYNLKNARGFRQTIASILQYSFIRHIAVMLKMKHDTTILPLEVSNFDSNIYNWENALRDAKDEREKHYKEGNEHLLE